MRISDWSSDVCSSDLHLKEGDSILVSKKPVGTLVADDLKPGKHLYLFATGTGLAPFMSIVKDPDIYERFEKIVLLHGVRFKNELAYSDFIQDELPNNEYFGDIVRDNQIGRASCRERVCQYG